MSIQNHNNSPAFPATISEGKLCIDATTAYSPVMKAAIEVLNNLEITVDRNSVHFGDKQIPLSRPTIDENGNVTRGYRNLDTNKSDDPFAFDPSTMVKVPVRETYLNVPLDNDNRIGRLQLGKNGEQVYAWFEVDVDPEKHPDVVAKRKQLNEMKRLARFAPKTQSGTAAE